MLFGFFLRDSGIAGFNEIGDFVLLIAAIIGNVLSNILGTTINFLPNL